MVKQRGDGRGLENRHSRPAYYIGLQEIETVEISCCVPHCREKPYAPAGTRTICRDHFLAFLTWRRRRGPQMFSTYAGMSMEERDTIAAEWMKTLHLDGDVPAARKL
jgi:hypothetical protein